MNADRAAVYGQLLQMRAELKQHLAAVAHAAARATDPALVRELLAMGETLKETVVEIEALLAARVPERAGRQGLTLPAANGAGHREH